MKREIFVGLLAAGCSTQTGRAVPPIESLPIPNAASAPVPEAASPLDLREDELRPPKGAIVLNSNLLRPDIEREYGPLLGDPSQILPGPDAASGARRRRPTAVLLFAPPSAYPHAGVFAPEPIVFQPALCAIHGKLESGVACGEAMPARARVRVTTPDGDHATMTVERSTLPFKDPAREGNVYPPPYGPSCCMYNGCQGKTVPYHVTERALTTSKTLLAVWPEDAELDLRPNDAGRVDVTWVRPKSLGPDAEYLLSTSDVDGDGRPEFVVYEKWRNDFGLYVATSAAVLHRFSCGNI